MGAIFEGVQIEHPGLIGLIRELFSRVGDLIRTQIELTKIEVKVEGKKLVMAGLFGLTAISIGSIFLLLLAFSVLIVLAEYLEFVWAAVVTTAIFLVLTGIFACLALWEVKRNSTYVDV
jgi:uncharacterized membrane protein YqjE